MIQLQPGFIRFIPPQKIFYENEFLRLVPLALLGQLITQPTVVIDLSKTTVVPKNLLCRTQTVSRGLGRIIVIPGKVTGETQRRECQTAGLELATSLDEVKSMTPAKFMAYRDGATNPPHITLCGTAGDGELGFFIQQLEPLLEMYRLTTFDLCLLEPPESTQKALMSALLRHRGRVSFLHLPEFLDHYD